jgi:hypothetical protein
MPSLRFEKRRSSSIRLDSIPMRIAIQLDHQHCCPTSKVRDERPNHCLAAKLGFCKTFGAQMIPKAAFGLCGLRTKLFRER